jgi:hypothetical protein
VRNVQQPHAFQTQELSVCSSPQSSVQDAPDCASLADEDFRLTMGWELQPHVIKTKQIKVFLRLSLYCLRTSKVKEQ